MALRGKLLQDMTTSDDIQSNQRDWKSRFNAVKTRCRFLQSLSPSRLHTYSIYMYSPRTPRMSRFDAMGITTLQNWFAHVLYSISCAWIRIKVGMGISQTNADSQ